MNLHSKLGSIRKTKMDSCIRVFGLVGSYGLIKLKDPMARLHAPTKATTLGVGGILVASMLYFYLAQGEFSFHEVLVAIFLFLTAPITANFIAKMHIFSTVPKADLPPTGTGSKWATLPVEPTPDARSAP
jgi:multicomponent K+:H+ antiporter subunit G